MKMIAGAILILSGVMTYVGHCVLRSGTNDLGYYTPDHWHRVLSETGPSLGGSLLIFFGCLLVVWGIISEVLAEIRRTRESRRQQTQSQ